MLDPACGTGGFLDRYHRPFPPPARHKASAKDKRAIEELIRGIEKKQLPHLLCTTNMLLHGIDVPSQIEHRNTLGRPAGTIGRAHEKVDCLVTNPPFGGYEDDGVGGDYPVRPAHSRDRRHVRGAHRQEASEGTWPRRRGLPDGFLFGEGIKGTLKELLLRECKLHTIIRLPKGVFAPYTTHQDQLALLHQRRREAEPHTETIWFYEHPYPVGYKSYSKTKPIRIEEFKPEQDWWGTEENDFADREQNEFAWKVDFKTKREQAEAAAQPHWQLAETLSNQAAVSGRRSPCPPK